MMMPVHPDFAPCSAAAATCAKGASTYTRYPCLRAFAIKEAGTREFQAKTTSLTPNELTVSNGALLHPRNTRHQRGEGMIRNSENATRFRWCVRKARVITIFSRRRFAARKEPFQFVPLLTPKWLRHRACG